MPELDSPVPSPLVPPTALLPAAWYWLNRTPLTVMAIYCSVSLFLEENYPFTHYPMYSNPSAERSYYLLSDADGKPLPVAELTGITCPKVGKMWRTKAAELASKLNISRSDLDANRQQALGEDIFRQLRHYAAQKGTSLPSRLRLSRVDIAYENGAVAETPNVLATE